VSQEVMMGYPLGFLSSWKNTIQASWSSGCTVWLGEGQGFGIWGKDMNI